MQEEAARLDSAGAESDPPLEFHDSTGKTIRRFPKVGIGNGY
jgi:hypothetical protein